MRDPGPAGGDGSARRGTPSLLTPEAVLSKTAQDLAGRVAGVFGHGSRGRYGFESCTALGRTAKVTHHLPALALTTPAPSA